MRKNTNTVIISVLLVFVFDVVIVISQTGIVNPKSIYPDVVPLNRNITHKKHIQHRQHLNSPTTDDLLDTLTWRCGSGEIVNFGFLNPGDSMLVWFDPPAACSLIAIRFRPINYEGNVILDIWDAGNYDPIVYDWDLIEPWGGFWGTFDPLYCPSCWVPGFSDHSPLGWRADDPEHHVWGPYSYTVTSDHAYTWVEIPAGSGPQGRVDLGKEPFYIGGCFYITAGWGFHAQYPCATPYNLIKFYNKDSGPGPFSGWFLRQYFIWFEAIVKYYEHWPPSITDLQVHNDTYSPGPFGIEARIEIPSHGPAPLPDISAELVFEINGDNSKIPMEGPSAGGLFHSEIPEIAVGDTVTYWVEAYDSIYGSCQSERVTFARLTPEHPEAEILIIWDCGIYSESSLDSFIVDLFSDLDSTYVYESWNTQEHYGIDGSVINWGWKTIYITGWGSAYTLPGYEYEGNIFSDWLEAGTVDEPHTLLYCDQDYFCVQQDYGCEWDEQLHEGDFMYDYFGIELAISDNHGSWEAGYDSVVIGEEGTEFEGILINFMPDTWDPTHPENNVWPDWIVEITNDAEQIFYYKDHPEYGAGVRLDRGHYRTVYLPWQDFFAVDSLENGDLVPRIGLTQTIEQILEWFRTKTEVQHSETEPSFPDRCRLSQNYPNPFNVNTDIRFQIGDGRSPSFTSLTIYNILGQEVKTLVDEVQKTGTYSVRWEGTDKWGMPVGSGVYFYQLKIGDFVETKRMLLLK